MEAEAESLPTEPPVCSSPALAAMHSASFLIGAKFVQEETLSSLAVEKLHPEVNSVVELGGQDAKIIIFKADGENGRRRRSR